MRELYAAIRCNLNGETIVYITFLLPLTQNESRFYAIDRSISSIIGHSRSNGIMGWEAEHWE